jgi:hypothetical protein
MGDNAISAFENRSETDCWAVYDDSSYNVLSPSSSSAAAGVSYASPTPAAVAYGEILGLGGVSCTLMKLESVAESGFVGRLAVLAKHKLWGWIGTDLGLERVADGSYFSSYHLMNGLTKCDVSDL